MRKSDGTNWTEYIYFGGNVIAEKDQSGAWTDYIFAGGKRVAKAVGEPYTSSTQYYHSGHLGSTRLMTDASGTPVPNSDATFLPFGQEFAATSTTNHYKFTGKERDAETGLDYFGARYYGSSMGRYTSPDWSAGPTPVPYADLSNPQSLNLYQYVGNNPMNMTDPDGHCWPQGACADALDSYVQTFRQDGLAANDHASPGVAAVNTFANGVTADLAQGFTNLLRTGESVGSLPEGASGAQIATAVAEEGGRVGGTMLIVVGAAGPKTPATAESGAQVAGEIGKSRVGLENGSQVDLTGKGDVNAAARTAGAKPPVTIPPPLPVPKKEKD